MLRFIHAFVLVGALATAAVFASGALAGGNSANAKLCQKDGWQSAQTGAGRSFTSEDDCIAYGARRGTVFAPSLTVAPAHVPEETDSAVTASGFHPNSKGDLEITTLGGAGGSVTFLNIPTNASGELPTFGTGFKAGSCADGVTGVELTFTDEYGVHASATVALDCA
jgi:hypothetical protein